MAFYNLRPKKVLRVLQILKLGGYFVKSMDIL